MPTKNALILVLAFCLTVPAQAVPKRRKPPAKPTSSAVSRPAKSAPEANLVESVSVQASGKFAKVVIQSSRPLEVRDIVPDDAMSLTLYMTGPTECQRPPIEKAPGDLVDEVRFGYKDARVPSKDPLPLDYITFQFKEPATHALSQREWVLQIELRPRGGVSASSAGSSIEGVEDLPRAPVAKGKARAVLPGRPSLEDFLSVGLANHVPLYLAHEEYRLARVRSFEATRGLFPTATGRIEQSEGTLLKDPERADDDVHFVRKEYGLQLGQPIFHSGGIYFSYKEAAARKNAAAQNVRKVKGDLSFDIIKAYHNLIKAQRVVEVRKDLMERMDKVIELTRKKRQLELITESEALGTESQYSQAYYRMLSDEKDLEISRLRMEALLNLSDPLPQALPDQLGELNPRHLVDLNVPVETFVDVGFKSRPEMLSSAYTAAAAAYAEKASKAEGRLRVDASGFIGRAGGSFTEDPNNPFTYKESWNVGLQASLFFLGNSMKGNRSKDRTSPDYGETTATDTDSLSASVGFLDGIKQIGDRRQARIAREKALHERDQTRRNIEVEVREAYYGIQKAKIQVNGAQLELDYRRKERAITRQKERMNLVDPSQALAAESAYGDAVNGWEEATAFYRVSLAQLEKAVGVPLDQIAGLK